MAFRGLTGVTVLIYAVFSPAAVAEESQKTEDQMIAEAIWNQAIAGFNDSSALEMLAETRKRFPRSAKAAYWHGRFGVREQGVANFGELMTGVIQSFAKSGEESNLDETTKKKFAALEITAIQAFAKVADRVSRAEEESESPRFELALSESVAIDPKLSAGWAAILESRNVELALAAADAWAAIEPDNALPLYAKAVVLVRARPSLDSPIPEAAIEALEAGNLRPQCLAPEEPWPEDFTLLFPESFNEHYPGIAGEEVPIVYFKDAVKNHFFEIEAIGNWSTISDSSLRDLEHLIGSPAAKLSAKTEARHLKAVAGVAVHMTNSNRFGLCLGSTSHSLNRLETLAVSYGDFQNARTLRGIRETLQETRRLVADDFRDRRKQAVEANPENWRTTYMQAMPSMDDTHATKLMQSRRKDVRIPDIKFTNHLPKTEPLSIRYRTADAEADLILIDVVQSKDGREHADHHGRHLHSWLARREPTLGATKADELTSDQLASLGIPLLEDVIGQVRRKNRTEEKRVGFFFIVRNRHSVQNVVDECFFGAGFRAERDPCLIALPTSNSLTNFREWYPGYGDMRLVQILHPKNSIASADLDGVSDNADAILLPAERLFQPNGEIAEAVLTSPKPIYASCSSQTSPQRIARLKTLSVIAGLVFNDTDDTLSD